MMSCQQARLCAALMTEFGHARRQGGVGERSETGGLTDILGFQLVRGMLTYVKSDLKHICLKAN